MIEFTTAHFETLCRAEPVRARLETHEATRKAAVRNFWLYLVGGILLAAAILFSLIAAGWPAAGAILALVVLVAALVLAILPLGRAGRDLKHPVLETLARQGELEYLPKDFEPPVFPAAGRTLFGRVSSYSFTDLFHGTDPEGRRYAVYEGTLTRRQGKSSVTVFSGQVYAFQRRSKGGGETAIVPDKGLFNFIKPKGMDRVKFESDADFEKRFEVYSTQPPGAAVLVGSDVRRSLLALREKGKVFAYVGPEDALVAVWGTNRFEPGSMFRSRAGTERVRGMFDDLCDSLAVLRELKRALD